MAVVGMVKFVGAPKLVEPPRGNCCALLPIGISKPKQDAAAKIHCPVKNRSNFIVLVFLHPLFVGVAQSLKVPKHIGRPVPVVVHDD